MKSAKEMMELLVIDFSLPTTTVATTVAYPGAYLKEQNDGHRKKALCILWCLIVLPSP